MSELLLTKPFTLAQAHAAGITRARLRRMVADGEIRRVVTGAYIDVSTQDTVGLRAAALRLVVPSTSIVCRRTAAWLLGVDVLAVGSHLDVPPIELVVPANSAVVRRKEVQGFSAILGDEDVVEIDGVLLTTPVRTACDCGRWLPLLDGVPVLDALAHAGIVRLEQVADARDRFAGQRFVRRLDRALDLADPKAESPMESRTRVRLVVNGGLPKPEAQIAFFRDDGSLLFRLDMGYRQQQVGVEYDGDEHHTDDVDRRYDDARRAWFERKGWEIIVARKEHIFRRWRALVDSVTLALESRSNRSA